ncbi:porin [Azomonas macrocytogenes]|uniref:Porin n=2 Tax=Azomonas macrocytogenes TaxID=69962 RepID=A0A839T132_AZOMA|nr:porin [Azomonas macrocytogenes]
MATVLANTVDETSRQTKDSKTAEAAEDRLDTSDRLLGDMGGFRTWLYQYGITLDIQSEDEIWGNYRGGTRRTTSYNGVGTVEIGADLSKLFDLEGGLFKLSWLNIRGRSPTADRLADYNPVSGHEAYTSNRLFELWYQQSFLNGALDIKLGQQDLDNEFLISDYASLFLNANFGWPVAPSANLYSGGPSWPLASLGIRFRYRSSERMTLMFAAANDNPTGHGFYNEHDPSNQSVHPHGSNFNLNTGALLISELQYTTDWKPAWAGMESASNGLPGILRVGGMYDTATFYDQRYDKAGRSLAAPDSSENPRQHQGNWIFYGIADQMLWQAAPGSPCSIGMFGRVTSNRSDRNVVDFAIDTGLTLNAPFAGRNDDVFGIGWGMAHTSNQARKADRDMRRYSDGHYPVRGNEYRVEITYKAQITHSLDLQLDWQHIENPGGGVLNNETGRRMRDESLFGLHSTLTF